MTTTHADALQLEGTTTRRLRIADGVLSTTALRLPGREVAVRSTELALRLDASAWRHDIVSWRWTRYGADGVADGLHAPGYDDASWATVPVLHPIYDLRYDGHAWFRQELAIPAEHEGERVTIVLGGLDDEDWAAYRVFLNGHEIDAWEGEGRWREPRAIAIAGDDPRYRHLRFDRPNLLAIETRDLARSVPGMRPEEAEHLFFQGWLLDQFVAVGEPYREVRDFAATSVRRDGDGVEVDVRSGDVEATLRYAIGGDGHLRKTVAVTNGGDEPLRILDVVLEELEGDFAGASKGGRGTPVLAGELFLGVEHPAGLNQGDEGSLRAVQLAGVTLAAGETLRCPSTVLAAAEPGQPVQDAFRRYVTGLRPRRSTRLSVYDTLGWTDYASEHPERPRLTEPLFDQVTGRLDELREAGARFDVFYLDDWWEPTDFMAFNRTQFPHGSRPLAERLRASGMGVGLWSATTQAAWTSNEVPGLEPAIAGGVATSLGWDSPPEETDTWDWDKVFAYVSMGQMRYCAAAEPFRGLLRDSLARHVTDTGAEAIKLDCAVLHCTRSDHGHAPGRHSVHAIHDAMLDLVGALREIRPELFVIWYWGFSSPWWLAAGDSIFDKGLKLESASPASAPAPGWRASVTQNADQAVRHADLIPLALQDSLGVWIGDVPWANWMGKAGWRDAFVLEAARGSTVLSLWGDLWMFDDEDVDVLAATLAHVREHEAGFRDTVAVGGDPWRSEPYGYAQPRSGGGTVLTAYNPSFEPRTLTLDAGALPGMREGAGDAVVVELYPGPGAAQEGLAADATLALELLPWEVRCVEIHDGPAPAVRAPDRAALRRETVTLALLDESPDGASPTGAEPVLRAGSAVLPPLEPGDELVVWVRVGRDGAWRYDPEPQSMLTLELTVDGSPVPMRVTPSIRSWNGPGCPWVTYVAELGPDWGGRTVEATLRGRLHPRYEIDAGALVFNGRPAGPRSFGVPAGERRRAGG